MSNNRASEKALGDLHTELAGVLKMAMKPEPILDNEGTLVGHKLNAAALNVARQFLKDNNIQALPESKPMQDLVGALPSFEDNPSEMRLYS